MNTTELVAESNKIEGILRPPTGIELGAFDHFLSLEKLTIRELENFVTLNQPGAKLRQHPGMDIYVGQHTPPKGGPHIVESLNSLLLDVHAESISPWEAHCEYETLHPFMDGNGRSGRALWHWMMLGDPRAKQYGFLHYFYYQTLQNWRK